MSHRIMTTISAINPARFVLAEYVHHQPEYRVQGYLSCEGPVEALLMLADGQAVDEIICLTSAEALRPVEIEYQGERVSISAYSFFCGRIRAFCEEKHIPLPMISNSDYDINNTGGIIGSILPRFVSGDIVDIDMTGGPRDMMMHIILCIEALEYRNVRINQIVYANHSATPKEIQHEEYVFRVNDLLTAVSDFTNHGKSDALNRLFAHTEDEEIRTFCRLTQRFSEKLSLCRTENISLIIRQLFDLFDRMAEKQNCTDRRNLEQVFYQLLPVLRENFVQQPSAGETGLLDLYLIDWCVRHDMLQQALTLFRENVPDTLMKQLELICPAKQLQQKLNVLKKQKCLEQHMTLGDYCISVLQRGVNPFEENYIDTRDFPNKEKYSGFYKGKVTCENLAVSPETANTFGVTVKMSHESLSLILTYLYYLQCIRNTVMHANGKFDGILKDDNDKSLKLLEILDVKLPLSDDEDEMAALGLPTATSVENIRHTLNEAAGQVIDAYRAYQAEWHRVQREHPRGAVEEVRISEMVKATAFAALGPWHSMKIINAGHYSAGDTLQVHIVNIREPHVIAEPVHADISPNERSEDIV